MMHLLALANLKSIPYMKARPSHLKLSSFCSIFSFPFFFRFLEWRAANAESKSIEEVFGWKNQVIKIQ